MLVLDFFLVRQADGYSRASTSCHAASRAHMPTCGRPVVDEVAVVSVPTLTPELAGRKREQQQAARRTAAHNATVRQRLDATETSVGVALRELRAPKVERLRVLILGAASEGDLRVGREQSVSGPR